MTTIDQYEVYSNPHTEFSKWIAGISFNAIVTVCTPVGRVAKNVFEKISPTLNTCWLFTRRRFSIVDVSYITALRCIDGIAVKTLKKRAFKPDSLKTFGQKKREVEILQFKETLGVDSIYPKFCRTTAQYINGIIPRIIAEKMSGIPEFAEKIFLFKLGMRIRYINRQLCKKTGYRDKFIDSEVQDKMARVFGGGRTHCAHFLLDPENTKPIFSFEHFLLKICDRTKEPGDPRNSRILVSRALESVGSSLSKQVEIDEYIKGLKLKSPQEELIARLQWHSEQGTLPKGAPDPNSVTTENVEKEFDHAMHQYLEGLVNGFLGNLPIDGLKKISLIRAIFFLEGKDLLTQIFTSLILEVGIKQLVDPHQFACAILFANNIEIADYELDGFGIGKRNLIFETGQKMMQTLPDGDFCSTNVVKVFEDSKLKANTGGMERIRQQQLAQERLKKYISDVIYKQIKDDSDYQHKAGLFTNFRKGISKFPVVGTAAMSLHLVMSGAFFAFNYPFRKERHRDVSLLEYLVKHIGGENLSNSIADWIVDLVYHPSWRFTLLHLIEALTATIEPKDRDREIKQEDLGKITTFLFDRLLEKFSVPIKESIAPMISFMIEDTVHHQLKQLLQPSEKSFIETGMESLLPSIKELMLYNKVIEAARKAKVHFEEDAKFWEQYLREGLNRLVARKKQAEPFNETSLTDIRDGFVDRLLMMDLFAIRAYFSDLTTAVLKPPEANGKEEAGEEESVPIQLQIAGRTVSLAESYHPWMRPPPHCSGLPEGEGAASEEDDAAGMNLSVSQMVEEVDDMNASFYLGRKKND